MSTKKQAVFDNHVKKLNRLTTGQQYVYHNSSLGNSPRIMRVAMSMYERGEVTLSQKRLEDGTRNYIATGRLSEIGKQRLGIGRQHHYA